MASRSRNFGRRDTYRCHTLRALNSLLFILPMLLLFQVGTAVYGTSLLAPRDLHNLLKYFGATAPYLPAVMVILVLMLQHLLHKDPWTLQPKVLAGMFGESILWMVPLIALAHLSGRLVANQAASGPTGEEYLHRVLQGLGAGIYEEFIFRLAMISLLLLVFVDLLGLKKEPSAGVAVIVSAIVFSLYHFSAVQVAAFPGWPWVEFVFRAVAGIYLGGLFVFRGYGIAVGAHAFYNLYVLISQP